MRKKQPTTQYVAMGLLLLCVVANPLEQISPILKWTDELICLCTVLGGTALWLPKAGLRRQIPKHMLYFIPFFVYMFMQLIGSLKYQFQPWSAVAIDALTNAKFWMTLYGGYLISRVLNGKRVDSGLLLGAKITSVILGVCAVIERTQIGFTGGFQTIMGMPQTTIFYTHTTYLAAVLIMLLAVMLAQWDWRLVPYALADMVLLISTFRSKAYGGALVFAGLLLFVIVWKQKIRIWQIVVVGAAAVAVAWEKIQWYFITLGGKAARSVLLNTSVKIMGDYFPFGTGFGTFGSHQAAVYYSPLYFQYGFEEGFGVGKELSYETRLFLDDSFWPIVFAQSGAIGTVAFVSMLVFLVKRVWDMFEWDCKVYAASLLCMAYLLISSTSEPTFNNSVSIPLALLLGYWLGQAERAKEKKGLTT